MKQKIKEKDVVKQITDYLNLTNRLYQRNNSGAIGLGEGAGRRFIRFGQKGSPDFFVFEGITHAIEAKSPTGKQSPEQIEWEQRFKKKMGKNGKYILARTLEDVVDKLKAGTIIV